MEHHGQCSAQKYTRLRFPCNPKTWEEYSTAIVSESQHALGHCDAWLKGNDLRLSENEPLPNSLNLSQFVARQI